jgi:site-specific DNA-methyltransferase (adenine-specific)
MRLINNDCIAAMKEMADNSVDSIVTDPPYDLGFMGKSWDASGIAFNIEVWQEALRVLKPGGHLLAFSGSRTYHRMTVAIEDAGFEIRDQIQWIYGSGFPKSLDIGKAIQKASGVEPIGFKENENAVFYGSGDYNPTPRQLFMPPLEGEAAQWQGWGTALKPAHEPIVLARKPLIGTVAANVLTHGVGGLNIDGSRVEFQSEADKASATPQGKVTVNNVGNMPDVENDGRKELARPDNSKGRWPANVIHDGSDEVVEYFGEPARFFYCAKASKRDRNEGLDGFEVKNNSKIMRLANNTSDEVAEGFERFQTQPAANYHPTVKPTSLMRYLCRLVTPPAGIVLDPFMGSGSTGKAAMLEGFDFIGIDQSAEYVAIAKARIEFAIADDDE